MCVCVCGRVILFYCATEREWGHKSNCLVYFKESRPPGHLCLYPAQDQCKGPILDPERSLLTEQRHIMSLENTEEVVACSGHFKATLS